MAIEVRTAADLTAINSNLSGEYIQMANINMAGVSHTSIGAVGSPFTGSYDGQGYAILNFGGATLFAYNSGLIQNVKMTGVNMNDTGTIIFVVQNNALGKIYSCSVAGSLLTSSNGASTIGVNFGTIEQVAVNVDFSVDVSTIWLDWFGGLLRVMEGGTIKNCYARGSLTLVGAPADTYNSGGLVGYTGVGFTSGSIENCYAAYALNGVSQTADNGGFIGNPGGGLVITNCYYDTEVSGMIDTGNGEPRTTAQMTYPESFSNTYVGWDFSAIWRSDSSYTFNDGYPHFGGFNIWVKKSSVPWPERMQRLWPKWEPVTGIWVYRDFAWHPVTEAWVKKSGIFYPE